MSPRTSRLLSFANILLFDPFAVNFKEVAPPTAESEKIIKTVYQLPTSDMSFTTHIPSSSQYSSSEMSGKDYF